MSLPAFDYAFLEYPVLIGAKHEVYSLLPDSSIREISGFGIGEELKALDCGSCRVVSWLLSDRSLAIYNKLVGDWLVKDVTEAPVSKELLIRQQCDEENQVFLLAICSGQDMYVLKVSVDGIHEFRIDEPLEVGFMIPYFDEISYFGRHKNEVVQTVFKGRKGKKYPLFDVNVDGQFLEDLGRVAGFNGPTAFSSGLKVENITGCPAGTVSQSEHIILLAIENVKEHVGLALISIDVEKTKRVLHFFDRMELVNQLDVEDELVFFYLRGIKSLEIVCVKYDHGQIQWADCKLDGFKKWPYLIHKLAYSDDVGIYALAENGKTGTSLFIKSSDALDFVVASEI